MNFSAASQHTISHSSNAFKSGPASAAVLSGKQSPNVIENVKILNRSKFQIEADEGGDHDDGQELEDGAVVILSK